jgi:hypothetical protein
MAAVVTTAAVGLGLANPERPPRRVASPTSYQVLGAAVTTLHGGGALLVDTGSGRLEPLALPPGMGLDMASVSPWEEDGRRQIVGTGWTRSPSEDSWWHSALGLVRMSLPDGEVLDRVTMPDEAIPLGPPCWVPGGLAGILYVGGDFRLYRVEFESSRLDGNIEDVADPRPRPLGWQTPEPGAGGDHFRDLAWPDDTRMGGRALASLRFKDGESGRYTDWQVWWLELGRGGTSIVAAGRLLEPGTAEGGATPQFPNLVTVDRAPALAYLVHGPDASGYQLRVAPIRFDPDSGSPHARDSDSRTLAEGCLPTSPAASPDGRWVTVVRTRGPDLTAERVAIPGGLARQKRWNS